MIRSVLLLLAAMTPILPGPLPAQPGGDDAGRFNAWVGGTAGFGTGGMAGRAFASVSGPDWALTGRYAKAMSGGAFREVFREDAGLLLGRVVRREGGKGIISLGAGRISKWDENYERCTDCWFGNRRSIGGTRSDTFGGLVEVSVHPGADGGIFAWGFTLLGAVAPVGSHLGAGITLGFGRTP